MKRYEPIFREAKNGIAEAQARVGNLYTKGCDFNVDYTKAYSWYLKAAKQGYIQTMVNTALMYKTYSKYLTEELDGAVSFWKKEASTSNSSMAKFNLAMIYLYSNSKYWDVDKGIRLLEETSDKGNTYAMSELAAIYYQGTFNQPLNYRKAFDLLQKAAEKGNPIAQNSLAIVYLEGKAVKRNDIAASIWSYIASTYGNYYLGSFDGNLDDVPLTKQEAGKQKNGKAKTLKSTSALSEQSGAIPLYQ